MSSLPNILVIWSINLDKDDSAQQKLVTDPFPRSDFPYETLHKNRHD